MVKIIAVSQFFHRSDDGAKTPRLSRQLSLFLLSLFLQIFSNLHVEGRKDEAEKEDADAHSESEFSKDCH